MKIYSTLNITEAHMLQFLFENNGIETIIENEDMMPLFGMIPAKDAEATVLVPAGQYKEAYRLLRESASFNLDNVKLIKCKRCGEMVCDYFDYCWNCLSNMKTGESYQENTKSIDKAVTKSTRKQTTLYVLLILMLLTVLSFFTYRYLYPVYDRSEQSNYQIAYDAYKGEDYQKALEYFSMVVDSNPHIKDAFLMRATTYYKMKLYKNTIDDLTHALAIAPKDPSIYELRGIAYIELRLYNNAIKDFHKQIMLGDDPAVAYSFLGDCYYKMKSYQKAIEFYQKDISLRPNNKNTLYNIACCYSLLNDKNNALFYLEKSITVGFDDASHIFKDKDLDNIRNTTKFYQLLHDIKTPNEK